MNPFKTKIDRIKNIPKAKLLKDFTYNSFSYLIFGLFLIAAIIIQQLVFTPIASEEIAYVVIGTMFAAGIITLIPMWIGVIQMVIISWLAIFLGLGDFTIPMASIIAFGILISPSFQLVLQWDKVVILRAGKFKSVHGPGLFFMFPIFDRIAEFVDTRIRATDFTAEKTLTQDTVPVHVDALAFWMIWDAQKAILEVENYLEAVTLSAQTALRDSIGKHNLSVLLSEREMLCDEIQKVLDAKTNPWGISILSVEFTEIVIPQALEDAMSKQAQAEREKQSRIILGTAEVEIAEKFEKAAERYKNNPTALHLRAMNMVYEGIRQNGSMMLLPSSALETMNLGSVMGTMALQKSENNKIEIENNKNKNQKGNNELNDHDLVIGEEE